MELKNPLGLKGPAQAAALGLEKGKSPTRIRRFELQEAAYLAACA